MKAIELSEEHKKKLLEMCKVLFAEYLPVDLELKPQYDGCEYYLIFKYMEKDMFHIHWFEFCMTHLMYKLSYEFSKIPKFSELKPIHLELWELNKGNYFTKHPIDYLYSEFTKLQNDKETKQ